MPKLKKIVKGIIGGLAISAFSFMPMANAETLAKYTLDGHTWKIKLENGLMLDLTKDGKTKCQYLVVEYTSFLTCATGYMGATEYSTIRDAITKYI